MAKEQKWEVASKLKIARVAAGLTQPELADRLNIPVSTYRTYEGGAVPKDQAIRGILTNWLASQGKKPPFVIKPTADVQKSPKSLMSVVAALEMIKEEGHFTSLLVLLDEAERQGVTLPQLGVLANVVKGQKG